MSSDFLAYVGSRDIHDARVVSVLEEGDSIAVQLESVDGRRFTIIFHGAKIAAAKSPEGMTLYALSEVTGPPELRRFRFLNWDEDDVASLEIEATGFEVK